MPDLSAIIDVCPGPGPAHGKPRTKPLCARCAHAPARLATLAPVAGPGGLVVPEPTESPWTLAVLGRPAFQVAVPGVNARKGSKKFVGYRWIDILAGKRKKIPNLQEEQAELLEAWSKAFQAAVELPVGWKPLDGPLVADFVVSLPRGSHPKWMRYPIGPPDLDKMIRADGDETKKARLVVDDARITAYRRSEKLYAGCGDPDALPVPGAVVRLWRVPEHMVNADRGRRVRNGASMDATGTEGDSR